MSKSVSKIIFFLFLFTFNDVYAVFFEHLNVKNGLSHYTVNSLYQDEHGLIWIGTRDGLNRYDGNEVTVFKQIKNDPTSLFGNNIRSVCGDKQGHLFMQCKSGLQSLDLKTEVFKTIRRQDVTCITYGKDNLWFATFDSVFSYAPSEETPLKLHLLLKNKSMRVTSLLESKDRLLFVATNTDGLLAYDKNLKIVKKWKINDIVYLYEDTKRNVWACTRYSGLHKIDFEGNITSYIHNPLDSGSIPDNFARTICEDDLGNYWVGLFAGLCKFNLEENRFTLFKYERQVAHGISNSSVWSIINDKQGTLWIGTYFGGIDLYNPKYSIYNFYGAYSYNPGSLSSPVVGRIIEADNGNLWIGTDGGGLNYFDRKSQSFKSFSSKGNNKNISTNTIKSIWLDEKRNNLWIGTHMGGLNKLNLKTGKFTFFVHNPDNPRSIPNNNVREIVHLNDTLYLATQNSIGVFDLTSEQCSTMTFKDADLSKKELPDLYIDSKNRMWFSHSNNVFLYNRTTRKLTNFKSNNNILLFFEDSKNRIWAGTDGDGIYLYNENTKQFDTNHHINEFLPSKYIIDFKESKGGYFYISTNAGLIIVDTELQNAQVLNSSNGFPLEALNENSIYISEKNEVFVGGINGMVSFQEKDLNIPRVDYEVNITGIRVNNKKISPRDSSIIKCSLPYLNKIVLKPEHSVVTILFSTTNYIHVLKSDVQYQLVGFDNDWIDANFQQSITYTNLNPGDYVLKLKGKNKTNAGIFPEKEILITVLPPFYKTTIAYIIYSIIILTITITLFRFYTSKIQLSTSLEYEKREKIHIEQLNQSKLRFFTNISHEFRTPLTLIINQIEIMLQMGNVPQSIYGRLLNVIRNANRMKKLITELIDFRKYEQGFMDLKVSENNIISFLNEIFLSFKELAQSQEITYTFEYKNPEIKVWFDENQMEKVFYNLISNAFKYTPQKGKITLKVEEIEYMVMVTVLDNGVGIDKKSIDLVFDRFYQAENSSLDSTTRQGSGIGLALAKGIVNLHHGEIGVTSESNNGSKFWVKLPLGDHHFKAEQKTTPQDIDLLCLSELSIPDKKFIEDIIISQKEVEANNSLILIIEDNEELLAMLTNIFQPIYKVITASDGVEGFEKAAKMQPDIILSDVMMPRMSGIEMCSKLKSNFETSHIPIVLLTAQTAADYIVQGLLTGADDYIIKPFNLKVLVTRCNNLVNSRKLLQKKFAMQPDQDAQLIATNSIDQQLLQKATAIVEKNIDNPGFDINMFASEMWLSRTNLFNKLKGVTGQTPNDFIVNMRLKKSIYYLIHTPELCIADIAIRVGFGSTSYYIKKFHKLYGVTPAQYRNQNIKSV
ncbi:MAG: two-component regulator propeller domain-containing protein [Paludibacter sp.]|nr:two-component regulator propeller domain-containing protein [Paludibacter sp.]